MNRHRYAAQGCPMVDVLLVEVGVDVEEEAGDVVVVVAPSEASSHDVPVATAPFATKRFGRSTTTVAASNTTQIRSDPIVTRTPTVPSGAASDSPTSRATTRMLRSSRSTAARTIEGPDG